jgi:serine protease AprX
MPKTNLWSCLVALLLATHLGSAPSAALLGSLDGLVTDASWLPKLEPVLQQRALQLTGRSRVVLRTPDATALALIRPVIELVGGVAGRSLTLIDAVVADVPNIALSTLGQNALVAHISLDRGIAGAMERTGATVGADAIRETFGYDGAGVGVAVIDSGAAAWPDDLADGAPGRSRVDRFVDFVSGQPEAHDDYGHGTHVAGIVAGNGFDSHGARTGIAPAARVIALKVLDASGRGRISDVIAAIEYAVQQRDALNIRVINLSVASGIYESYLVDPLTLAAQRAVAAGIVVVAAAGNNGRTPAGAPRYGGITAPGNAPWVLTVGASSHMGTTDRADDTIAAFSSRGPSAIDRSAKPDLVAPGVGIESLSDPDSAFYLSKARYLLSGSVATSYLPYLSLSGTSMATPVVSGTVALMLQANPQLTPDAVKGILQYTAQRHPAYDRFTQGAGFLNAKGAVELARFLAAPAGTPYPSSSDWTRQLICDSCAGLSAVLGGGGGTAGGVSDEGDTVVWGTNDEGDTVVWGTSDEGDTVVWGTSCTDPACEPEMWGEP